MSILKIGFGGGCHWCTEAVFQSLRGVTKVEQGFIKSHAPQDSYSEAALVTFDSNIISLDVLIDVHLRTHACTTSHKMRGKYRSAVYVMNSNQEQDAGDILKNLQGDFDNKLVTRVLLFSGFESSDEKYHNYYANNSSNQFCHRYIDPKLETLRRQYAHLSQD